MKGGSRHIGVNACNDCDMRAAAHAGRHSAPEAEAFTAFRLPSLLAKPALARNSPSHPCGPLSACGGQLCSVLKQGALDASPGAMRKPVWLRGSAPPMGPRTYRPGPLGSRPWHEGAHNDRCWQSTGWVVAAALLRSRGAQELVAARDPARFKHWIGTLCLNAASRR
jgi:hypothetical protein